MPRTALFPNEDTPITIKQGQTGDCYLLASLDCILNASTEGRRKVKSMFTETEHGVTIRIKRNSHSTYLKPDKLRGKYDYHYDTLRDEDVFVISNERLDQVDGPSVGVTTNSLAVKIIERLSSYYYIQDWQNTDIFASVIAHNVPNRHDGTSTAFVGKLLDVYSEDNQNLDELIKLKTLRPEQPLYLSMSWGRADIHGKYHGRHGLRVDRIVANPMSDGGYDVVLVNPWDNQKTEIFSLADISKRSPRFCAFDANPKEYQLTRLLLECSDDVGRYVTTNPALHDMLVDTKVHGPLNSINIQRYVDMHKQLNSLPALYNALDEANKKKLIVCFNAAKGDKDDFLTRVIKAIPTTAVVKQIVELGALSAKTKQVATEYALTQKDASVYKALITEGVDVLSVIKASTLNHQILLQATINFEKLADRLNAPLLKAIAQYTSKYNQDHKEAPLALDFSEDIVFELVLQKAIQKKALDFDGNVVKAQSFIEEGLVIYYYGGESTCLTRSGNLRFLFLDNTFNKTHIETQLLSKSFLIQSMAYFMNGNALTPGVTKKLEEAHFELSTEHCNLIVEQLRDKNPLSLFMKIYQLHAINPSLTKELYQHVVAQAQTICKQAFRDISQSISLEKESDFKDWFMECKGLIQGYDENHEKVHEVVTSLVKLIDEFPISYADVFRSDEIVVASETVTNEMRHVMYGHPELLEVQTILQLRGNSLPGAINDALEQKQLLINQAAEVRFRELKRAEDVIRLCVGTINSTPYHFESIYTESDVQNYKVHLVAQMQNFSKQDLALQEAHKTLGFNEAYHPDIALAIRETSRVIEKAAERRIAVLVNSKQCIQSIIHEQIELFSVSFDMLRSPSEINESCYQALNRLYGIIEENQALVEAQGLLGFTNAPHPEVTRAIEKKAQSIIIEAEQYAKHLELYTLAIAVTHYKNELQALKTNTFSNIETVFEVKALKEKLDSQVQAAQSKLAMQRIEQVDRDYHTHYKHEVDELTHGKLTQILMAAESITGALQQHALETIQSVIRNINQEPTSFSSCASSHAVDELKRQRIREIKSHVENNAELSQALKNVQLSDIHQNQIQRAFDNKLNDLNQHSDEQQDSLLKDERKTAQRLKCIEIADLDLQTNTLNKALNVVTLGEFTTCDTVQKVDDLKKRFMRQIHTEFSKLPMKRMKRADALYKKQYTHGVEELKATKLEQIHEAAKSETLRVQKEAQDNIKDILTTIDEELTSFSSCFSAHAVDELKRQRSREIKTHVENNAELRQALQNVQSPEMYQAQINDALDKKLKELNQHALDRKQELIKTALDPHRSTFDSLMKQLRLECAYIRDKASKNKRYKSLEQASITLFEDLKFSSNDFFSQEHPNSQAFEVFKQACQKNIKRANHEFGEHRGWHRLPLILRRFLGVIATLTTLFVPIISTSGRQMFKNTFFTTPETNSAAALKMFEQNLDEELLNPLQTSIEIK